MQRLLAAVLMAGVVVCVNGDVSHIAPPSASAPQAPKYPQPAPAPAPAPAPSPHPAPPTQTYAEQQGVAGPSVDEQGYYYYYYPVQQDKTKGGGGGLFDLKNDSGLISLIIVGVLVVGGLLVALSFAQPDDARTLQVSYHDVYQLAAQVYQAINKIY